MDFPNLKKQDPEIYKLVKKEEEKQQYKLSMIPSENFSSPAVRASRRRKRSSSTNCQ